MTLEEAQNLKIGDSIYVSGEKSDPNQPNEYIYLGYFRYLVDDNLLSVAIRSDYGDTGVFSINIDQCYSDKDILYSDFEEWFEQYFKNNNSRVLKDCMYDAYLAGKK